MVRTYNEFKVIFNGNEVVEKIPTKRGSVRISEETANVNNKYSNSTKLVYELAEEKQTPEQVSMGVDEQKKRIALEKKAKELGINFRANIGNDTLQAKIEAIESK